MSAIRVSIIEDDAPARKILADWLNRTPGFECVGQYGATEEAIESVTRDRSEVVLTDIHLPGANGIECVRRLKRLRPDTQFVMLTVYEDADHIFDALTAGATGYLLKQTPLAELIAAIRSVHAGGSPMTSNIARKVVQSFQRTPAAADENSRLSPREREVLEMLARGFLYKEIAESAGISLPTVNTYIRRIYEKLQVHSRSQAVARYAQRPLPSQNRPKAGGR